MRTINQVELGLPEGRSVRVSLRHMSLLTLYLLLWASSAQGATVTAMEYYIDADPGRGLATPIPSVDGSYNSSSETGQVTVATTSLKVGPHMLYVRAKSSTGAWGTCPPKLLYVYDRPTVAAAEYYIDSDPGLGNGTALQAVDGGMDSVHELITVTTVPISGLAMGTHTLYIRARNSRGLWGPARAIPFDVLRTRFIAGAHCGVGGPTDTAPTSTIYAMDPVNYPFDSAVEDVVKSGVRAASQVGTYRAFVQTWDSLNLTSVWAYAQFTVVANPLLVTTTNLPDAMQNVFYSAQLAASGGQTPYMWGLVPGSGNLPQGLTLGTNGVISGTPLVSETNSFTVQVADAAAATNSQPLSLAVAASTNRPAPILTAPVWAGNGQFQFSFSTALGSDYTIQFSTTLTNWTSVLTICGSGLPLTIADPNAGAGRQRFYRVVLQP